MIHSFRNQGTEDVYNGVDSKAARKVCPQQLVKVARRKLELVNAAVLLSDLRMPPNNKLEALKHERAGQHAIRINDAYRVCFVWKENGAYDVEITDYH